MFTGIIQHVGGVARLVKMEHGERLSIDVLGWSHSPARGDSVSVNGCCLTVADSSAGERVPSAESSLLGPRSSVLHFDVIHQTLRSTTLGRLREGGRVNLEHAATPSSLLGGHIVQGHVDGVGVVMGGRRSAIGSRPERMAESPEPIAEGRLEHRVRIEPPAHLMEFVHHRGSVAVDGVSLTIASVDETSFEVALIPTTIEKTTLGGLREGDDVNLEVDYLAKIVVEWLKRHGGVKAAGG